MKTYLCDSCKEIITHPYKVKMKEFLIVCDYKYEPLPFKQKKKIHLCNKCYEGLCLIAEENRGENSDKTGNN